MFHCYLLVLVIRRLDLSNHTRCYPAYLFMYKDEEVLERTTEMQIADPFKDCIDCFEKTCTPEAADKCNHKSPLSEIAKCYLEICGTPVCQCLGVCLGILPIAGGKLKEFYKQDKLSTT